ncbi:MAG: hypothetical protein IT554_07705 [Sphingomonadaceae bacterium]|nr:hypothetical protein [Sphingobium sp.]MBP9157472.1 hypothetical protein [Sphingobium sp.]MCC6482277.1 hypothetical protein [Sphingomonadaceae bacterium]
MIGKLIGGMLGSSIAEKSGKSGAMGAMAGLLASNFVRRSPIGALVIGGAWLGHKLYKRNQERRFEGAAQVARSANKSKAEPKSR